ncbi:hypothetical protein BDZ89DRAFT_1136493 [Hymenopellis radicata]|nr:hypothetical protein BDZ89DRAFT_1136493 [Hymenopellis radicata]
MDINLPQRVQNLLNRSNGLAMRGMTAPDNGIYLPPLRFAPQTDHHFFDIALDLHLDETHFELKNRSLTYWQIRSLETDEPDLLPFTSEDRVAWEALDELLASKSPLVAERITVYLCSFPKLRLTRAVLDAFEIWWEDLFPQTVHRFNFVEGDDMEEDVAIDGTAK